MLRVYTAAHEADGVEEVDDPRRHSAQLRDARQLRPGPRHPPGRGRRRGRGLRPRLLAGARRGRPLVRELRLRPSGVATARDRRACCTGSARSACGRSRRARRRRAEVARLGEHRRRCRLRRPPARRRLHRGALLLRHGGAHAGRHRRAADARRPRAAPGDARPVPRDLGRIGRGVPRPLGRAGVDRRRTGSASTPIRTTPTRASGASAGTATRWPARSSPPCRSRRTSGYGRPRVYVDMVSVRRPWRRRGLARALLASSLVGAREAGFTSASLGVDTDSPTGATDLYRSLGFVPERTFTAWRKPL